MRSPTLASIRRRAALLAAVPALAVALVAGQAAASPLAFFTETTPAGSGYSGAAGFTPLVGDFDGNGTADVFFYHPGPQPEALYFGTSGRTFGHAAGTQFYVSGTYTPLVGDFDGNGSTDIFWYKPGTGADYLWLFGVDGSFTQITKAVNGTYKPIVGDFASKDDKHADDIFWYAPGRTADSLWRGIGSGQFQSTPEVVNGTYTPVVGAFTPNAADGSTDATLDIFWYAPGTAADSLFKGDGSGNFTAAGYTVNGTYQPVVGFFDGYGVQDILWYSPTAGNGSVWLADPDTKKFTAHGITMGAGYRAVTGEFTIPDEPVYWYSGSGLDHFWLPQGEPGTWDYTELSNNSDLGAGYTPVTGDFDGDGHPDIYWIGTTTKAELVWYGPG